MSKATPENGEAARRAVWTIVGWVFQRWGREILILVGFGGLLGLYDPARSVRAAVDEVRAAAHVEADATGAAVTARLMVVEDLTKRQAENVRVIVEQGAATSAALLDETKLLRVAVLGLVDELRRARGESAPAVKAKRGGR